ncbi:hypothetical protein BDW22DRAFT_1354706 [Trametopsis cervina]|nr:hypothetical protein BDW22DRAFT_1354706 [Trametopsis cervina]
MPVLEIVIANSSDAYRKEGSKVVDPAAAIVAKTEGHLASYSGDEIQDKNHYYLVVAWETHEHHLALINDKEVYPGLGAALFQGITEIHQMQHIKVDDGYPALESPIAEFTFYTLRPETDRAKFAELVAEFYNVASNLEGVAKGGQAPFIEDERKWAVLLGFKSLEEEKRLATDPKITQLASQLSALADATTTHVVFRKHDK